MGYVNNPKKAVYNSVYDRMTMGASDIVNNNRKTGVQNSAGVTRQGEIELMVTNDNLEQVVHKYPQVVDALKRQYESWRNWAIVFWSSG